MSNRIVLASVAGVAGIGILNAVQAHQGISRIVAGAYIALLLLSLLDLFGGAWSQIASGLAILAFVSVLLASNGLFEALTLITKQRATSDAPATNATQKSASA
jgi:hypothetical protein